MVGCLEFGSEIRVLWGARIFVTISTAIIFYSRNMAHGIKNSRTEGQKCEAWNYEHCSQKFTRKSKKEKNYLEDKFELGR